MKNTINWSEPTEPQTLEDLTLIPFPTEYGDKNNTPTYIPVTIVSDDSGHDYIIRKGEIAKFYGMLESSGEHDDYTEFEEAFGSKRCNVSNHNLLMTKEDFDGV